MPIILPITKEKRVKAEIRFKSDGANRSLETDADTERARTSKWGIAIKMLREGSRSREIKGLSG
jgi:hypothetical protein